MTAIQVVAALDVAAFSDPRAWPDRQEASNSYSGEIVRYGKHRVILCRDGIQWIIQSRESGGRGKTRWRGRHYCTTKTALMRLWGASEPLCEAIPALAVLPDNARDMGRAVS